MKKGTIKKLIKEAKEYNGSNDFINDVVKFYNNKGFITDKQKEALEKALDNEKEQDCYETFGEHYSLLKS